MSNFIRAKINPVCAAMIYDYFEFLHRHNIEDAICSSTGKIIEFEHFIETELCGRNCAICLLIDGTNIADIRRNYLLVIEPKPDRSKTETIVVLMKDNKYTGEFRYQHHELAEEMLQWFVNKYAQEIASHGKLMS